MIPSGIEVALAFVAGLLIGSFLNVCVYRLPRDLSVVKPARSFCPHCEKTIAWYDNIPLLSFLILRAKCRHCGAKILWRYPAVELATGVAFAICMFAFGLTAVGAKWAVFAAIQIALIASDFEERILPDEFTLGGTVIGIVFAYFVPVSYVDGWPSVIEAAIGAGVMSGMIWLVGWLYQKVRHREGMGFGDVKMIAMIGAFLGLQWTLMTLIAAAFVGAIGGLIYIFLARKKASEYELPFGSFLGIAALAVAIYARFQRIG